MPIMRRSVTTAVIGAVLAGGVLVGANPALAAAPADPTAQGVITLCGPDGRPVTGGTLLTAPFVWKAVASEAAPKGYSGTGQLAQLTIYQVRPGVDPSEWSGDTLTDQTSYAKSTRPVAQATSKDQPLGQITDEYPPKGAGYYELRMYYSKTNDGTINSPYPAAMIQVVGNSWKLVRGGGGSCAPTGKSSEVLAGVAPAAPAPSYAAEVAAAQHTAAHASGSPSATGPAGSSGTAPPPGGRASNAASVDASRSANSNADGHAALIGVGVGAAVVIVAGGAAFAFRRRSS